MRRARSSQSLCNDGTYALAVNYLDFGRFLAGCAREKSSNCVSPKRFMPNASAAPERLIQQLQFVLEIDKLKGILRQTLLTDASRWENSAEHSWHLALMAIALAEYAPAPIDPSRVVQMPLTPTDTATSPATGASATARPASVARCGPGSNGRRQRRQS
ncbi:HD domain-containing protein [Thermoleptolyngbya sp.]